MPAKVKVVRVVIKLGGHIRPNPKTVARAEEVKMTLCRVSFSTLTAISSVVSFFSSFLGAGVGAGGGVAGLGAGQRSSPSFKTIEPRTTSSFRSTFHLLLPIDKRNLVMLLE